MASQATPLENKELFVVGIAASAGGLPSLLDIIQYAHCHSSICFVIVAHMARFAHSNLANILARFSRLKVVEIEEGMELAHCHVYTIPPNRYVGVHLGKFCLQERPPKGANHCADFFFTDLAQEYGPNAIGVVLSGGFVGQDGSKGVVAIREAGGRTFAQSPDSAEVPSMPLCAIETGSVEHVLDPIGIGKTLASANWVSEPCRPELSANS